MAETLDQKQEQKLQEMLTPKRRIKHWDEAELLIPASDGNGHSERAQFRLMPAMQRVVHNLVASKKWFRTADEFYRWAVWRGLRELHQREEKPVLFLELEAAIEILRDEQLHIQFDATIDTMRTVISQHMARGNRGEATRLAGKIRSTLEAMPEGEWRAQWLERFMREFGYLLEQQTVQLNVFEAEAEPVRRRAADEVH